MPQPHNPMRDPPYGQMISHTKH